MGFPQLAFQEWYVLLVEAVVVFRRETTERVDWIVIVNPSLVHLGVVDYLAERYSGRGVEEFFVAHFRILQQFLGKY